MACMGAFHGIYTTGDKFRSNRQLIQDLMTTTFLNNHMGPAIYSKGLELLSLFESKMRLAEGRSFSIKKDLEYASLDVMLAFAFGDNWLHTALGTEAKAVKDLGCAITEAVPNLDFAEQPITFPSIPLADFLNSVYEAPEVVERTINAIAPKVQTWWWSKQTWYKKIFHDKEQAMKGQIAIGINNIRKGHVKTGVEHMLMREAARAEKEGREPEFNSRVFRDEVNPITELQLDIG